MKVIFLIAQGFWKILAKLQEYVLVLTSSFLALAMFAEAFLRYVFKSDLFGIEEVLLLVVMWLYFIGGAYGSYEKKPNSGQRIGCVD